MRYDLFGTETIDKIIHLLRLVFEVNNDSESDFKVLFRTHDLFPQELYFKIYGTENGVDKEICKIEITLDRSLTDGFEPTCREVFKVAENLISLIKYKNKFTDEVRIEMLAIISKFGAISGFKSLIETTYNPHY